MKVHKPNRIREFRKAEKLSLREVSEGCGISIAFLNKLERHIVGTNDETKARLARYLEKSLEEVFPDDLQPEPEKQEVPPEPEVVVPQPRKPSTVSLPVVSAKPPTRGRSFSPPKYSGEELGDLPPMSEDEFAKTIVDVDDPRSQRTTRHLIMRMGGRKLA